MELDQLLGHFFVRKEYRTCTSLIGYSTFKKFTLKKGNLDNIINITIYYTMSLYKSAKKRQNNWKWLKLEIPVSAPNSASVVCTFWLIGWLSNGWTTINIPEKVDIIRLDDNVRFIREAARKFNTTHTLNVHFLS